MTLKLLRLNKYHNWEFVVPFVLQTPFVIQHSMPRFILLFILLTFIAFQLKAQEDLMIDNFEKGTHHLMTFNGTELVVVDNPLKDDQNSSEKVLLLSFTKSWEAVSKWFNDSPFTETYDRVSVDVYSPDGTGLLKLNVNSPISDNVQKENYMSQNIEVSGSWVHLEYDISALAKDEYRQIAFFPENIKHLYFDNIKILAKENDHPVIDIQITADRDGIHENNRIMTLGAVVSPSDANNTSLEWSIVDGAEHALLTSDGQLVAISDGDVTVQARALDGSDVQTTRAFSISNQQKVDGALTYSGTLRNRNSEIMRGCPLIIGKKLESATKFATDIETCKLLKSKSMNTVRICWVDPWYQERAYENWTLEEALPYIDRCVANATAVGLSVILNYHSVGSFTENYSSSTLSMEDEKAFWRVMANRYKDNEDVYFELINEPIFGDGRRYTYSPFKDELLEVYDIVRQAAPLRHILLFSFNNCDTTNAVAINTYSSSLDWDYTTIAYHMYGTKSSEMITQWMKDYRVICTEWDYPGHYDYVVPVDGYELNLHSLETIRSSWIDWGEDGWGTTDFDRIDDVVNPEAQKHNYWWGEVGVVSLVDQQIEIYPNPCQSNMTINSGDRIINSVSITQLDGKQMMRVQGTESTRMCVDVSLLGTGIYIVSVQYIDHTNSQSTLIKK